MRISALILQRIAWLVPTLAGLVPVVFFISHVIPADPVAKLAGETAARAQIELLRQKLGLDRPLLVQLVDHYRQMLSGDLGSSLFTTRPVLGALASPLPARLFAATPSPTTSCGSSQWPGSRSPASGWHS